ncbi:MAG: hypothetical protein IKO22_07330 [Oscillospiraceae bacterium]|nr:hypothetical protein [Oscillospiraceae bacterium]
MSIIGNAILAGGGGANVTVTVYGAKNEIVTYSGVASGTSSALNDQGIGYVSLPKKGAYTFVGSISGYLQTANVQGAMSIYLRPVGAIYWYGAVLDSLTPYVQDSIVYNDTSFKIGPPPPGNTDAWNMVDTGDDGDGYTEFTVSYRGLWGTTGGQTYSRMALTNANSPNAGSGASYSEMMPSPSDTDYKRRTMEYAPVSGKTLRVGIYKLNSTYWVEINEMYKGDR